MNSSYKRDAQKIWAFFDNLKQQPWLGDRKAWVDYLFHFTHLENAVNIIESGFLCSRVELKRQNIAFSDSASSQVIQQTYPEFADQVRFYFRPLTPTTYHMEGFRPVGKRFHDAHCPMPVYLLFDIREIISHNETGFSNGNLASEYSSLFTSADDFARLPFADIYHEGPPHYEEKRYITRTKQAEVIYPKKISLDHLKYIYCRSQAEKETQKTFFLLPFGESGVRKFSSRAIRVNCFRCTAFIYQKLLLPGNQSLLICIRQPNGRGLVLSV